MSQTRKLCDELTYADYIANPIWGFADDDGDEVMSVDYPDHLIWSDGGEALWVKCKFLLNDSSELPGVVGIRMTDQTIYLLEFIKENNDLFVYPVSALEGSVTIEELSHHLNKPLDSIFPITYITPYKFQDGQLLTGQYSLGKKAN